jgi:hypothetical protein
MSAATGMTCRKSGTGNGPIRGLELLVLDSAYKQLRLDA